MKVKTRNGYDVLRCRYLTEKSSMLEGLRRANSNKSLSAFSLPKYVFIVDPRSNKREITKAVESVYSSQDVKVSAVNIINVKGKKRRVRGFRGYKPSFKKAIVTLSSGEIVDEVN